MRKPIVVLILALLSGLILFTACEQPAITSAKVYLQNDDYENAIEQCEAALENDPADPDAHYIMGTVYEKQRELIKMNEAFDRSLTVSPKYADDISQKRTLHWTNSLNQGVALYQQDKPAEAIEKFLIAASILPEKAVTYKFLALAYSSAGQPEKALDGFKKAYELDPMDLEAYYLTGKTYFDIKDYETTAEYMQEFMNKAEPENRFLSDALYYLGIAYDLQGKPEEAIEVYRNYLAKDPDNHDIRFNLGAIFLRREQWEDALEMFSSVFESKPDDFYACLSIGQSYLGMEDWADAVRYLEKATEIQPDNAEVWHWLGTAYVRNNQLEKAQAAFDKHEELSQQ